MVTKTDYDFTAWATKSDLKCSDGRTIMKDAFKHNDGEIVPLVWNHQHNDVNNVLGQALLENRPEGVFMYGKFNDSSNGQTAKLLLQHGDINAVSICANELVEKMSHVFHGNIREVSLVLASANPGATIQSVLQHGEEIPDEAVIFTDETVTLYHADDKKTDKEKETPSDNKEKEREKEPKEKTIGDIFKTLNEEQANAVYAIIGDLVSDEEDDEDDEKDDNSKGGKEMKHNIFDTDEKREDNVLTHADQLEILEKAKNRSVGTLQNAISLFEEEHEKELTHADATAGGFAQTDDGNVSWLFPEYKDVRPGAPELITDDQGWISTVMNRVHKCPMSRIRTQQVDIRKIDALRAKGYVKGKEKKLSGNFKLVRRTTDPQTVYVRNALHRDDIVDITDFDYVSYLYNIDRMMLNEEIAKAILIGDGREEGDADRIDPEHIRPIWLDDDLYTIHVDLDIAAAKKELQGTNTGVSFGENYIYAEATINTLLYARENYKGTGTPDMYLAPHMLNVMLLARDMNGRRIYASKAELAAALNVGAIHTVEQFEGKTRTAAGSKKKKLLALIANLNDYSIGSTKGGEITHFTQFDIDFNQEKSLIETRLSGALTRVYSAIALEEDVTESP